MSLGHKAVHSQLHRREHHFHGSQHIGIPQHQRHRGHLLRIQLGAENRCREDALHHGHLAVQCTGHILGEVPAQVGQDLLLHLLRTVSLHQARAQQTHPGFQGIRQQDVRDTQGSGRSLLHTHRCLGDRQGHQRARPAPGVFLRRCEEIRGREHYETVPERILQNITRPGEQGDRQIRIQSCP